VLAGLLSNHALNRWMRFLCAVFLLSFVTCIPLAAEQIQDSFEAGSPGLAWTNVDGFHEVVSASTEPRLAGISLPATGERVLKVAEDGDASGIHLVLAGPEAQNMSVEAWVFCEGNDGSTSDGGYQAIVARAAANGYVRLAWDPDHSEAGDTGDGWVKLQAYAGSTWDYLGIDYSLFGSATQGYILNGTTWPSGWHRFKLTVEGAQVSAYVDDMAIPAATGELSVYLSDGQAGFYVFTSGDYAGYFDDFIADVTPSTTPEGDFDVIIRRGEVYPDGETGPLWVDVGIIGEKIVALGDLSDKTAGRVIDASGLLVTPGFIDAHTHADGGGSLSVYLRQGVTTIVTGNCGSCPRVTGVDAYYDSLEGSLGANYIGLIGHNSLRYSVGLTDVTPTVQQMTTMKTYLDDALRDGAFGMSTGLYYQPGYNSTTEEVIELAKVVAGRGGVYASHMRSEMGLVLEAVDEAIRIGHEAGCPVQISHVKCSGPDAWGKTGQIKAKVDTANAAGDCVRMDQYPYTASQTTINVLFPPWALDNWSDAVSNHRAQLEEDVRTLLAGRGGADRVYLISGTYRGQYLSEVASSLSKDPEDVLIDNIGKGGCSAIYHVMLEEDVQALMAHPMLMVGSDGPTSSHPRGCSTFPRSWGHYGRDLGLFAKREAVMKSSTLAARQFRLIEQQRGALRIGYYADIVVFDYEAILDRATFDQPTLSPLGISYVLVNGEIVINNGGYTPKASGKALRLYDSIPSSVVIWNLY